MRKVRQLAAAWLALSLLISDVASAEDITTTGGKVYKVATVIRSEPDGILINYKLDGGGIGTAKVKFTSLGESLQREYGFDPLKAAAFEASQARAQVALQARMQADYIDATNRLAKRLAREEAQWQADQEAASAKLRAQMQQVPGGGGNFRGGGGGRTTDSAVPVPITYVPNSESTSNPPQSTKSRQQGRRGELSPRPPSRPVDVIRAAPGQRELPANGQPNPQGSPAPLPQDVVNRIEQQAAERAAVTGVNPNAIMLEALKKAGASSQQLQQAAAQRGVVLQNVPSSAAPAGRK
jgi:hypothetical protein